MSRLQSERRPAQLLLLLLKNSLGRPTFRFCVFCCERYNFVHCFEFTELFSPFALPAFLRQIGRRPEAEKPLIKTACAVIDSFHFDVGPCEARSTDVVLLCGQLKIAGAAGREGSGLAVGPLSAHDVGSLAPSPTEVPTLADLSSKKRRLDVGGRSASVSATAAVSKEQLENAENGMPELADGEDQGAEGDADETGNCGLDRDAGPASSAPPAGAAIQAILQKRIIPDLRRQLKVRIVLTQRLT